MLTGKELGEAIRTALKDNEKTPADAARHFGIKPPSVSGWMATGRISKGNFDQLTTWLSKTPRSHWGLSESISQTDQKASQANQNENLGALAPTRRISPMAEAVGALFDLIPEDQVERRRHVMEGLSRLIRESASPSKATDSSVAHHQTPAE